VGIFVVKVKSLSAGNISVVGDRALAIVADGEIVLDGVLSVDARSDVNGPGAQLADPACRGRNGAGACRGRSSDWPR
jgi:hypothetical protein